MTRHFNYVINAQSSGLTVYRFLQSQGFSRQNIIELKKAKESILVNGIWSYVNRILCENDCVDVYVIEQFSSEKIKPVKLPLNIIYEDEDLLIVNKEANMPTHPSLNHYEGTLANSVAYYYTSQNIPYVFRCVNRLDKDTTGITVLAKNMVSGNLLSTMTANREMKKIYLALVDNSDHTLSEGYSDTINAPIARCSDSLITRRVCLDSGERAVTHYKVISTYQNYALIVLRLETGRTHQIRVHMNYVNHTLLGDTLYGGDTSLISRHALHSYAINFYHPFTKKELCFFAQLPKDMLTLIESSLGSQPFSEPSLESLLRNTLLSEHFPL